MVEAQRPLPCALQAGAPQWAPPPGSAPNAGAQPPSPVFATTPLQVPGSRVLGVPLSTTPCWDAQHAAPEVTSPYLLPHSLHFSAILPPHLPPYLSPYSHQASHYTTHRITLTIHPSPYSQHTLTTPPTTPARAQVLEELRVRRDLGAMKLNWATPKQRPLYGTVHEPTAKQQALHRMCRAMVG